MELLKHKNVKKVLPFGSRVVGCANENSDYDYLVLVGVKPSLECPEVKDFMPDSDDPLYGFYFSSWRKGDINLVFTDSEDFFNATEEALNFCIKYKVYDKKDRCRVHEAFREHLILKDTLSFD